MKWTDEIVDEVRKAKDAYAAQFDYDLERMFVDLKKKEQENPAPRQPRAAKASRTAGLMRQRCAYQLCRVTTRQTDTPGTWTELGHHITPAPENMRIMGLAEAPVPRLKAEYRYQLLIKSGSRKDLNALVRKAQEFARAQKWNATALVIDVDPLTLL